MNKIKRVAALVLSMAMITSMCACGKKETKENESAPVDKTPVQSVKYTDEASSVTKSETVYISLDNNGNVTETNVTDWLHTDSPEVKVTDISDLENVTDINTGEKPAVSGKNIVWNMDTTDLYYSGTTKKEAPVKFDISYYMNGKEMTAEEIAGKSGHAEIKIKMTNKCYKDYSVDGKKTRVYLPLLAAGGMILPESSFSAVSVTDGLSFGDGTKQIVAAAGVPGLCESLGIEPKEAEELIGVKMTDEFVISADTNCFEIGNIYFAVIPFCSLNLSLMVPSSTAELANNLSEIKKVFNALENIDISSIMGVISGNSADIGGLVDSVNDAIKLYDSNKALLSLGSKYCTEENLKAIRKISDVLGDEDFTKGLEILGKTDLSKMISSLPEVTKSLGKVSALLKNETFASALEILSSPVMVKFFKQLPLLSSSLESVQKLAGDKDVINALNALSDPSVSAMLTKLPDVMDSAAALAPLLGDLQSDLSDPEVKKAVDNLPETMKAINKLLNTIDKNSSSINKIISLASDKNVKELIDTISKGDISPEELSKKLSVMMKGADEISGNLDLWIKFGNEYGLFSQKTENEKANLIFVYNTPTIDKPQTAVKVEAKPEEHWYDKILNIFR